MGSYSYRSVLGLVYAVWSLGSVSGQTTNTTCQQNATTSFLFNSLSESPCAAWAKLQALCVPPTAFINVPPLVDHTYGYNSPGAQGTACQCNLVAYNLMAGCSWCQIGSGGTWSSQWAYSQGCKDFKVDNLGFSQDSVDVPSYAWRNWDTERFDPALAAAAAPSFAATSLAPQSTTLSRSFPTAAILSTSQSQSTSKSPVSVSSPVPQPNPGTGTGTDNDPAPKDSGPPMGVMIGAIAGSIGAVVLVALLIFFLIIRRRKRSQSRLAPIITLPGGDEKDGYKRGSRRFDPNYHSSTDWKSKHRSFLEILTPKTEGGDGNSAYGVAGRDGSKKGKSKPFSQLFTSPRTAPLPFGQFQIKDPNASNSSVESLRYTTTSERLGHKRDQESFSSGSELSFGLGQPNVQGYTKARHAAPAFPQPAVTESIFSQLTAGTGTGTPGMGIGMTYGAPPPQSALLQAVNQMRKDEGEDDPLDTPPAKNFDEHSSYPFPRTPPIIPAGAFQSVSPKSGGTLQGEPGGGTGVAGVAGGAVGAGAREKALPTTPGRIKTRISTKIPDSRFSTTGGAITLPQPPITPAHDFTLDPDEYRRKQSRHISGGPRLTLEDATTPRTGTRNGTGTGTGSVLPSLYEPGSAATRFSVSQRTDAGAGVGGGTGRSRPVTQFTFGFGGPDLVSPKTKINWNGNRNGTGKRGSISRSRDLNHDGDDTDGDGESIIFSATHSISASTDSRYSSFILDAQTVARVKAAFVSSLNSPSPKETGSPPLRFPLPPSRSGSKGPEHEWERAKTKKKLSQEVKKIGRKGAAAAVEERGDENGLRRKGI